MRFPRSQNGQATVELALCLPLIALLLAAFVEVASTALDQVRVWHAAREGARVAAVEGGTDKVRMAAYRAGLDDLVVRVDPLEHNRVIGEPVTVDIEYRHEGRVPLLARFIGPTSLRAAVTTRIEQP